MRLTAFAPAKINLFLHVGAPGGDGYHPLCSLMVFADVGDRLALHDADALSVRVHGAFAADLAGEGDNLVLRAARALLARARGPQPPVGILLDKALPVAAGLGGGSSDAGAALRLVRDALGLPVDEAGLEEIAASLGADGAACFRAAPVVAEGRGERLSPAPGLPPIEAVLVNPGVQVSTPDVYRALDASAAFGDVATEVCIRTDGDEGLFASYSDVQFRAPVRAGDCLEIEARIVRAGNRSREMEFEVRVIARGNPERSESAADVLDPPIVATTARGVVVVPSAG